MWVWLYSRSKPRDLGQVTLLLCFSLYLTGVPGIKSLLLTSSPKNGAGKCPYLTQLGGLNTLALLLSKLSREVTTLPRDSLTPSGALSPPPRALPYTTQHLSSRSSCGVGIAGPLHHLHLIDRNPQIQGTAGTPARLSPDVQAVFCLCPLPSFSSTGTPSAWLVASRLRTWLRPRMVSTSLGTWGGSLSCSSQHNHAGQGAGPLTSSSPQPSEGWVFSSPFADGQTELAQGESPLPQVSAGGRVRI